MTLTITVPGIPAPQGSKKAYVRGGRAIMVEANPRTKSWRSTVTAYALTTKPSAPLLGPVNLAAEFVMPRPQSHFRTGRHAGQLRDDAPGSCAKKPDLSKLIRAVEDSLTDAGWWRDDAQVVSLKATLKRYTFVNSNETPHVRITVTEAQ